MFKNDENGKNKGKRRATELAIVLVIVLAFVLIKVATGNKGTPSAPDGVAASLTTIPEFDGTHYVIEVNNGSTYFTRDEIQDEFFTKLSDLDDLNRAGSAVMCADEPHIQEGERSSISDLKPSGWHGGGFYERSHLLMWKLTGINEIENLVTGTATFNEKNMQDYEKKVTRYLWDHEDNHVMYRVTPLFLEDELVCRGVLMEAYSVEDDGQLEFCVFVYNAEPGSLIDYKTGDYMEDAENMTQERPEQAQ